MKHIAFLLVFIVILIMVMMTIMMALPSPEILLQQIGELQNGTTFELSDYYSDSWDVVQIINTPMGIEDEDKIDEIFQLFDEFDNIAEMGDCVTLSFIIFYKNNEVCNVESYNYCNEEFPIFCDCKPENAYMPVGIIEIQRENDLFEVIRIDGHIYAVWLPQNE